MCQNQIGISYKHIHKHEGMPVQAHKLAAARTHAHLGFDAHGFRAPGRHCRSLLHCTGLEQAAPLAGALALLAHWLALLVHQPAGAPEDEERGVAQSGAQALHVSRSMTGPAASGLLHACTPW